MPERRGVDRVREEQLTRKGLVKESEPAGAKIRRVPTRSVQREECDPHSASPVTIGHPARLTAVMQARAPFRSGPLAVPRTVLPNESG